MRSVRVRLQRLVWNKFCNGLPSPSYKVLREAEIHRKLCAVKSHGRPISHWTPRELATEVVKLGIVTSISPRHVGRLMAEADVYYRTSRSIG